MGWHDKDIAVARRALCATMSARTASPLSTRSSTSQSAMPLAGRRSFGKSEEDRPGDSRSRSSTNTRLPCSASHHAVAASAVERPTPPLIEKNTTRGAFVEIGAIFDQSPSTAMRSMTRIPAQPSRMKPACRKGNELRSDSQSTACSGGKRAGTDGRACREQFA